VSAFGGYNKATPRPMPVILLADVSGRMADEGKINLETASRRSGILVGRDAPWRRLVLDSPTRPPAWALRAPRPNGRSLAYYVSTQQIMLEFASESFQVRGAKSADQFVLADLTSRNLPRLAWVVAGVPNDGPAGLVIQVHSFPQRYSWSETLCLCVDRYTVKEINRAERDAAQSLEQGIAWLDDQFILPALLANGVPRLFISAGAVTRAGEPQTAFRIHGPYFLADVRKGDDSTRQSLADA
jgi:hypothetical protein